MSTSLLSICNCLVWFGFQSVGMETCEVCMKLFPYKTTWSFYGIVGSLTRQPEVSMKLCSLTRQPEVSMKLCSLTRQPEVSMKLCSLTRQPEVSMKLCSLTRQPEVCMKSWSTFFLSDLTPNYRCVPVWCYPRLQVCLLDDTTGVSQGILPETTVVSFRWNYRCVSQVTLQVCLSDDITGVSQVTLQVCPSDDITGVSQVTLQVCLLCDSFGRGSLR